MYTYPCSPQRVIWKPSFFIVITDKNSYTTTFSFDYYILAKICNINNVFLTKQRCEKNIKKQNRDLIIWIKLTNNINILCYEWISNEFDFTFTSSQNHPNVLIDLSKNWKKNMCSYLSYEILQRPAVISVEIITKLTFLFNFFHY